MKMWVVLAVLAMSASSYAEEEYLKYDDVAIKRFDDELRRLDVVLPSVTELDQPAESNPPIVTSPAGEFEGFWTKSQFGRPIAAFEGIPFAQPPVGPLRFQIAQPLPPLLTPLKATKPGNVCVQSDGAIGAEDCLFINVYAPENTSRSETERLPVMFYIHGGAFISGSGGRWKPDILLDNDILLVTCNYRLGTLGFLTTEDEIIPGNLGLKDQLAALVWTKENIASFGGNPNLITVAGLSAGAVSAEFHMVSPLSKGLVQRAISSSGSANSPWALCYPGEMRKNVRKAAEFLDCPAEPSEDLLACLQTKTAAEIMGISRKYATRGEAIVIPFKPIVEGYKPGAFLPDHPKVLFTSKNQSNDIPFLTGVVSDEGTLLGPIRIFNDATELKKFDEDFLDRIPSMLSLPDADDQNKQNYQLLKKVYFGEGPLQRSQALLATNLFTDTQFLWPAVKSIQYHSKGALSPAYFYYFSYQGSRSVNSALGYSTAASHGVNHGDDVLYLFPFPGNPNVQDIKISMIYADLVASFVRDGVPSTNLVNVTWTPFTPGETDIPYLHIKSPADVMMKKNLFQERWTFIETLFGNNATQQKE